MNITNTPESNLNPNFWVGVVTTTSTLKPPFSRLGETGPVLPLDDISKVDHSKTVIGKNAVKHDDGKTDWSLVPFEALEGMADVLSFGAKKYASWNWTEGGGFSYTRVLRSCLRHIFAFMRGEDNDPESGLSHISHAQCNLLFLAYYIRDKKKFNKDDRNVR